MMDNAKDPESKAVIVSQRRETMALNDKEDSWRAVGTSGGSHMLC